MLNLDPIINLLSSISMECTCHEGYASRDLRDPQCEYHSIGEDVVEAALSWGMERVTHWQVLGVKEGAEYTFPYTFFDQMAAKRFADNMNRKGETGDCRVLECIPQPEPITPHALKREGFQEKQNAYWSKYVTRGDKEDGLVIWLNNNAVIVQMYVGLGDEQRMFPLPFVKSMSQVIAMCGVMGM